MQNLDSISHTTVNSPASPLSAHQAETDHIQRSITILKHKTHGLIGNVCTAAGMEALKGKFLSRYIVEEFIIGGASSHLNAMIFRGRNLSDNQPVALNFIPAHRTRDQKRLELIKQEIALSKHTERDHAVHTYERIDLFEVHLVVLVQELATGDLDRLYIEYDDESFLILLQQCLACYNKLDQQGWSHNGELMDFLYFPEQKKIKLSAFENATKQSPGQYNSLKPIQSLITTVFQYRNHQWMSDSTKSFAESLLNDHFKTAEDALGAKQMQAVAGLPLKFISVT